MVVIAMTEIAVGSDVAKIVIGNDTLWERSEWTVLPLPDHVAGLAAIKKDESDGGYWLTGQLSLIPVSSTEAASFNGKPILPAPKGYKFNDFMNGNTGLNIVYTIPNNVRVNDTMATNGSFKIDDGQLICSRWPTGNQADILPLSSAFSGGGNVFESNSYMIKVQLIKED